mgnify:CR=1 FL=1
MFYRWQDIEGKEVKPGVRRTTIVGQNVSVSYVELEAGVSTPLHQHEHEQIVTVVEGEMQFETDEESRVLRKGEAVVFGPNVPHLGRALNGPALVWEALSPARHEA